MANQNQPEGQRGDLQQHRHDGSTPPPSVQPEQEGSATRQSGDRSGAMSPPTEQGAGNQQTGRRGAEVGTGAGKGQTGG